MSVNVRFELGERHFDRVEIGTIWRQEQEPASGSAQCFFCLGILVGGEVVQNDDGSG